MSCGFCWRIALTLAGLEKGSFYVLDLPIPEVAAYSDHTLERPQGDGGQALHGFNSLDMLFAELLGHQWFILRKRIDDAKAGAGVIYLTIDAADGKTPGPRWVDVSAYPHRPVQLSQEGPLTGRSNTRHIYENVRVLFNNITIINDPSIYTDA